MSEAGTLSERQTRKLLGHIGELCALFAVEAGVEVLMRGNSLCCVWWCVIAGCPTPSIRNRGFGATTMVWN